jgi:hypothetical protein
MAADAILFELGVRQLAARISFGDVTQRDAVRNFNFDADGICHCIAANLCKSGEPFLHRENIIKKIVTIRRLILKI